MIIADIINAPSWMTVAKTGGSDKHEVDGDVSANRMRNGRQFVKTKIRRYLQSADTQSAVGFN
ncbi:hypothetical protein CBG46_06875 [Actinobacillus succinogenes]|nr:hypothetical protein CBG46_06875 [Actinobacillus succinogenes]